MVIDIDYTYLGEHSIACTIVKSLWCTPKTDKIFMSTLLNNNNEKKKKEMDPPQICLLRNPLDLLADIVFSSFM